MANISTTEGKVTITITTKNNEILAKFLYLQKESEKNNGYETTILDIPYTVDEIIEYVSNQGNTFNFLASGRWSFSSNLNWFMDCLTDIFENTTEEIQVMQKELQKEIIEAEFEYVDYESGCDFIVEEVAYVKYDGTSLEDEKTTITINTISSDNYTIQNLLAYGINIDDMISVNYLLENDNYIDEGYPKLIPHKEKLKQALEKVSYKDAIYYSMEELLEEYEEDNDFLKEMLELIKK